MMKEPIDVVRSGAFGGIVLRGFTRFCPAVCGELARFGLRPAAIMDRNPAYAGMFHEGIPVVPPERLSEYLSCLFIVMAEGIDAVRKELAAAGVPDGRVIFFRDFLWSALEERNNLTPRLSGGENLSRLARERFSAVDVSSLPRDVTIETSAGCNLNCVMCYYHEEANKRDRNAAVCRYSPESFQFLMPPAREIHLQIGGEPLMSRLFWDFLAFIKAKRPDAYLGYKTNGVLLNGANIEKIVASSTKSLSVSLDAATAETYRRIRGYDFAAVIDNIRNLTEARRRKGRDDLALSINMTVMRENVGELDRFVVLARKLGVDYAEVWPILVKEEDRDWRTTRDGFTFFYYQQELRFYPNLARRMLERARIAAAREGVDFRLRSMLVSGQSPQDIPYPLPPDEFVRAAEAFASLPPANVHDFSEAFASSPPANVHDFSNAALPHHDERSTSFIRGEHAGPGTDAACPHPWESVFITANGDARPCCYLRAPLGNIYETPFAEIWNGPLARDLRGSLVKGRLNAACAATNCPFALAEAKADPSPLPFGETVRFGIPGDNSREYAACGGLSHPDADGTWFNGGSAALVYRPSIPAAHRLVLTWRAFIVPGVRDRQRVEIAIGSSSRRLSICERGTVTTEIEAPPDAVGKGLVEVKFFFPDAASPKELGLNPDLRRLSFQLSGLTITEG